jgi:(p)ppGpp synthase/HD superfamily hydrolase
MSPTDPAALWSQDHDYIAASRFAARAHRGQIEASDNLPYLLHLTWVAMEVLGALRREPGLDEGLAVRCALLHDCLEDTPTRLEDLEARFGAATAQGVLALTKDATLPKAEQMPDSLRRIRLQPREVWMVKLADRICNLQPPPKHWSKAKAAKYREEAREILAQLGEASPYLAARLADKIDNYAAFVEAIPV